jgi:hypothetical protein
MTRTSEELKTGFTELDKNPFWQIYREELLGEFNRVQQALIQNPMSEEKELRTCTAIMNAFQTALNLPRLMVERVATEEELEKNDGQSED